MVDTSRTFCYVWLVVLSSLVSHSSVVAQSPGVRPPTNFPGQPESPTLPNIDPNTPIVKLLPEAPEPIPDATKFVTSLNDVPEIRFERPLPKKKRDLTTVLTHQHQTIRKILHVNRKEQDGYLKAMIKHRQDLQGVPFLMGKTCRLPEECWLSFDTSRSCLHSALNTPVNLSLPAKEISRADPGTLKRNAASQMWNVFHRQLAQNNMIGVTNTLASHKAGISILMQVMAPESKEFKDGLVASVSQIPHIDATKALAHLAIFAEAKDTHKRAIKALELRREQHYTDVLARGLNYPWPDVARNATEAIVALDRKDMVPALIAMLEQPDPRMPYKLNKPNKANKANKANKGLFRIRHLVKVFHNQNCLLCHPPVSPEAAGNLSLQGRVATFSSPVPNSPTPPPPPPSPPLSVPAVVRGSSPISTASPPTPELDPVITTEAEVPATTQNPQPPAHLVVRPNTPASEVPIPGQEMPSMSGQYGGSHHNHIVIRLDVTYLRPDFSRMEKAKDVAPWPELQRFDYLVRQADLSEQAAKQLSAQIRKSYDGELSPYQRHAHAALGKLTGKDLPPNAEAWRKACKVTTR
ncbi:MAG: HEAT repeat domain-containing protein [Gemmataceae bacterium]